MPTSSVLLSDDEKACEQHFLNSYSRNQEGRFVLRLPFKSKDYDFSNSYLGAKNSFIRLEKRLHTISDLANSYHAFMNEHQLLSHMQLVSESVFSNSYFIPHHGIFQREIISE